MSPLTLYVHACNPSMNTHIFMTVQDQSMELTGPSMDTHKDTIYGHRGYLQSTHWSPLWPCTAGSLQANKQTSKIRQHLNYLLSKCFHFLILRTQIGHFLCNVKNLFVIYSVWIHQRKHLIHYILSWLKPHLKTNTWHCEE